MKRTALLVASVVVAAAQSPAKLESLSFLVGHWRGVSPGTVIEEMWLPAEGDAMYSLFRMVREGKTRFTEFQSIEQRGDTVMLVLRHFHAGLIAWEEKDAPMVWTVENLEPNRVVFAQTGATTRLEYHREGDALTVTLIKEQDGKTARTPFRYRLAGGR